MHPRSVRIGLVGAAALAVFYAAVVGGASGSLRHLGDQMRADWYLLVLIIAGFGIQVGLIAELRLRHRLHAQAMAASGAGIGASTAGMVACCAHHVADLAPFVGATGAATFLTDSRMTFIIVGIGVNAIAIGIAARRLHQLPSTPRGEVSCVHA